MAKKTDAATADCSTVVPTVETVNLVGTIGQKTGEHKVFADGRLIALFHDGITVVDKEVAKLLKELGMAE